MGKAKNSDRSNAGEQVNKLNYLYITSQNISGKQFGNFLITKHTTIT